MLGIAISGATAHSATRILEPLRDLFAAIFFVAFGLTPTHLHPAGAGVGTGPRRAHRRHQDRHRSLGRQACRRRASRTLPRGGRAGSPGRVLLVIAGLAVTSGVVEAELAALATAYVLIMAVLGPLAARYIEPLVKKFSARPGRSPSRPEPCHPGADPPIQMDSSRRMSDRARGSRWCGALPKRATSTGGRRSPGSRQLTNRGLKAAGRCARILFDIPRNATPRLATRRSLRQARCGATPAERCSSSVNDLPARRPGSGGGFLMRHCVHVRGGPRRLTPVWRRGD